MFKLGDKVKIIGGHVSGQYDRFREGTEGVIREIQLHPTMGVVYTVPQSAYLYPEDRLELVSPTTQIIHQYNAGDAVIYHNPHTSSYESGVIIRVVASTWLVEPGSRSCYNIRTSKGHHAGVMDDELMSAEYSLF